MVPPSHALTSLFEQQGEGDTANEHAEHCAPRSDARPQQDESTDGNRNERGLTDRTRDESEGHIHDRGIGSDVLCQLTKWCGSGEAVRQVVTQTEDRVLSHPNGVTSHLRRISKEQEHAGCNSRVKDIHTCTTEYLLTEDD